jgi:hypothetical protein
MKHLPSAAGVQHMSNFGSAGGSCLPRTAAEIRSHSDRPSTMSGVHLLSRIFAAVMTVISDVVFAARKIHLHSMTIS